MRLDNYLVKIELFDSRTKAKQAIERKEIFINGKIIDKPSFDVDENAKNDIKRECVEDFVSLGGYKLSKALRDFDFNVKDFVCADIGASTGGFTDCLLKSGAKKVYSVDLNDDLLSEKLKNDDRVKPVIKNARYLKKENFNEKLDLISADLSFISESLVLPVFYELLPENKFAIILIKPQFENDKKIKFKNGIVGDKKIRIDVCKKIYDLSIKIGFTPVNITTAPIVDGKNVEYLILLKKGKEKPFDFSKVNF